MIKIILPDESSKELKENSSILDLAKLISEGLSRVAIAGKVNGKLVDLDYILKNKDLVEIITPKHQESLEILRHTTAHVFAQALLRLYPKAKITIGPPIENGFYYDVDYELKEEDLEKIEKEMQKIIKEDLIISKEYKTKEEALEFFKNNEYKKEIIEAISKGELKEEESHEAKLEGNKLKFYKQGEFNDLCTGPHLPRTGLIKAFRLEKITKAYWRGNSENKQLSRIYGTAFWKKTDLENYYKMLEEAKKRDHRILGEKMKLFTISNLVGSGLPLFQPRGQIIRKEIEDFLWELHKNLGYKRVWTPHIAKIELYKQSGHYEHYKENFQVKGKDGTRFMLKPMNCPHHMQIFSDNYFSYRDMPVRYFEPASVYRDELSGTLSGLTRVRAITQDDGHLFCKEDQIKEEVKNIVKIILKFYKTFNMDKNYWVSLSVRDKENKKDYVGSEEIWNLAENALEEIAKELKITYKKIKGEAAFYGPKLDFMFKDSINREWQLSTIQLDFNLPKRFNLFYVDEESKKQTPVVIHRAISGSLERAMALLIEHFAGKLPLWVSPVQVKIINVADRHISYCQKIKLKLEEHNFRVESDFSHESVSKKIAMARENDKPNYMLILGDKDVENKIISVRTRKFENGKNEEFQITIEEFIKMIIKERDSRQIKY